MPDTPANLEPSPQQRSEGIAWRRGLSLLAMTLVLPGSAQLAAGNRRLGRSALRIWLGVLALVAVFGVLMLAARSAAIAVYTNPITLYGLGLLTLALGLGWIFLFVDAWRIANPVGMASGRRPVFAVVAGLLALAVGFASFTASSMFAAQASLFGNVFTGGGNSNKEHGRYNILLLGGDAGADRTGLRPDTVMVASIDADTGRTVLFSLPRNLQRAPFPATSPLHKLYPDGYWCRSQECMLNAIYTLGQGHKKLYPKVKYPGVQATKEAVEEILGLRINYWAMVDMKGFQALIDAVGGIRLDVTKKVPIGGGTDLRTGRKNPILGYVGPGKNLLLDGYKALWFARSREGSTDYERMIRQKCVMNAMLKQLNPVTVATKFNAIAAAGEQIVATDLPTSEISGMLDLAQKGKALPLASVSFSPPLIRPAKPDFAFIRTVVRDRIAAAEALDDPNQRTQAPSPSTSTKATKKPSKSPSKDRNRTDDLDQVCRVSS